MGFLDDVTVEQLDADPYPVYARMRAEQPVGFVPCVDTWFVTRHADVAHVAERVEQFTAESLTETPVERSFGKPTIITVDGPVHAELRRSFDTSFRPKRVESYVDALVRPIAEQYLAELAAASGGAGGRVVELMADYLEPISTRSLAVVLGLGDVEMPTLRRWFHGLSLGATNYERDPGKQAVADATAAEIDEVVVPQLERLRREPDDSTMSHMLHAGVSEPRPVEFVLPSLKVAILGGMQEPGHGAGTVLAALLDPADPAQLAAVRAELADGGNTLVAAAVEEGIRWVAPIGTQLRTAVRDVDLGGVTIPAGAAVAAVLASANRDDSIFPDPDTFDLYRHVRTTGQAVGQAARDQSKGQAGFGFGRHFCSGHSFARHQMRIAVEVLLQAHPALALADDRPVRFRGWEFRAPAELNVVLTPPGRW
jgi:aromatic O-demethylase, cytochrome P450 subunit